MWSLSSVSPRSASEPGTLKRLVSRSPRFAAAAPPTRKRAIHAAMMAFRWRTTARVQRAIALNRRDQITSASEAAAAAIASRSLGLQHALQVEHPRAEGVELARADDREARHAGLPRAGRDLAGDLALQRLLVDPALADDDRAGGAHARVEVQRAEHERRAGLQRGAVLRPQPAAEAARRSRSSARRADRAAASRRTRSAAVVSRLTVARVGALLRAEDLGGALEGRAHVAQARRSARRAARRPSSIASMAPAAPSVVALPPHATSTTWAPASTAATMSSPVPRVEAATASRSSGATSASPLARAISMTAVPPSSISA